MKTKFKFKNMITLTESLISELSYFQNDENKNSPITAKLDPGHEKLIIITGENATGKSFFRKIYQSAIKKSKNIEVMHLSQQGRSTSGMFSSLIYGDESYNSTGYLSARVVMTGIKTCQDRETPHYIIFDEPDIGLSESYSAALGIEIRKFVENLPKMTKGIVIISHSKNLIKQLTSLNPTHVRLGNCPDLNTWLTKENEPGNLEDLFSNCEQTYQSILKILKDK